MGIINNIGIASDIASLASGNVPTGAVFRIIPYFFHRKKGLTKAQLKKLMMRRRRMFVDNVVMIHERRIHKKSFEERINQTKSKLSAKPEKILSKPSNSPTLHRDKARSAGERVVPKQGSTRTKIKGLIDIEKGKTRSKWAVRVNTKSGATKEV